MKKNLILSLALISCLLGNAQEKNSLLDASFWKTKPDLTAIKAEIAKGNDPSQSTDRSFDPVVMAILNDAPQSTIQFLVEQSGNSVQKPTHDNRIYLHWAAGKGDIETIKYLIDKGSDVNLEDSHSSFPITAAASSGVQNTAVYDAFFKAGINPTQKYQDGANLLLLSIASDKNLDLATYFATKGMSLKDVDANGSTAFDYVAKSGNISLLKTLLSKGVKPTDNALLFAAQGSRRESNTISVYQYLINEVKLNPRVQNKEGETALHLIANKADQNEIITYLIANGAASNAVDKEGNTPLMIAATSRDIAALELLLPLAKDKNAENSKGQTALSSAVVSGTPEAVALLLENGANVAILDKEGNNLGYYMIQSYRSQAGMGRGEAGSKPKENPFDTKMKLLQNKGLDLASSQNDGNTLYHLAVIKNDLSLLKKLAPLQIDVNAKNKDGLTALHKIAMVSQDDNLLKYFLSIGAKKEISTDFDETPYDLAKENETLSKNNISVEFLK
ncbi:ankyrin repeat domain-containing protein [Flavobacterium algicola]|uniref:ankyrin repeat domain-containing protein n=1 Tax=Flavobacterium algicola TaxID=556529 RepID=UPI001EFC515F|nr:ankyrin repeat domain-containing protein [Flavobacterium algicola]MCG9792534.1 ankyrin repeat domain-containing protein [Flavobacterium algicola]